MSITPHFKLGHRQISTIQSAVWLNLSVSVPMFILCGLVVGPAHNPLLVASYYMLVQLMVLVDASTADGNT